ncbi:MAG TPA: FMN-binding glutamate synthase family protein [Candidatus Xenobia bacterium]|nr:FMN-binding glutamate synthase family protein [Candidatus Xenobia bacterium]
MTYSRLNASAATLTKNRTEDSVSPFSGMCTTCVDGCIGMCEIGKSAYRGPEMIYPQPFGIITTASGKDYPVDLSHFTILGRATGAWGIAPDSDVALFPNVNLEVVFGRPPGIHSRLPFVLAALGSTNIAKNNWESLAVGSAISGTCLTVGENVCGMDPQSNISDGRVLSSPELEWRVRTFREWQEDGYGEVIVQANVEDTMLGVHEYALTKLGVKAVELKWGQGAKDIGGEVKIRDLEKARLLKQRGYVVLPDPDDPVVEEAFGRGSFREFERHSRIGMANRDAFLQRVEELRKLGARWVFLKTGAYRPVDLARAVKWSSEAGIDLLTVDAAGGGTGMSPWRMMNEWGVPAIELHSLLRQYCDTLAKRGDYVPPISIAGGFTFEDQIFKGLALVAPYARMISWARGPLAAAMVGKTIGHRIEESNLPVYVERFGTTVSEVFVTAPELQERFKDRFKKIPTGAIGLYTYYQRVAQGLRQLMCGARKFSLEFISRDDIAALTPEAASLSGIPMVMESDQEEAERVLCGA